MLVIGRKKGESLLIGDDIEITIIKTDDNSVKLSISAPKSVTILRKELLKQVQNENQNARVTEKELLEGMSILKSMKK